MRGRHLPLAIGAVVLIAPAFAATPRLPDQRPKQKFPKPHKVKTRGKGF